MSFDPSHRVAHDLLRLNFMVDFLDQLWVSRYNLYRDPSGIAVCCSRYGLTRTPHC
jgi:hypothetical protein